MCLQRSEVKKSLKISKSDILIDLIVVIDTMQTKWSRLPDDRLVCCSTGLITIIVTKGIMHTRTYLGQLESSSGSIIPLVCKNYHILNKQKKKKKSIVLWRQTEDPRWKKVITGDLKHTHTLVSDDSRSNGLKVQKRRWRRRFDCLLPRVEEWSYLWNLPRQVVNEICVVSSA